VSALPAALDWRRDGADWPNRECSQWIEAAGLRWHLQRKGQGPVVLLLHGTGAATHSWRDLLPRLAPHCEVIAPDLPGHGFTTTLPAGGATLPGMAQAVASLLRAIDLRPAIIVGHSAGAAIAVRLCLDAALTPRALLSLNGALLPWRGLPSLLFAPAAKLLASSGWAPRFFARRATDPAAFERLLATTGSRLDAQGRLLYARLVTNAAHVGGALQMMANWDLYALERDLPRLTVPLTLVVGDNDRTVSPAEAQRVRALLPAAMVVRLPGLGHLAHEECPDKIARLVEDLLPR
jgi:magnesium chelatase accessory protein